VDNMGTTYYIGKAEGATWGVVRAFWLPIRASVRRRIRRAPLAPPTYSHYSDVKHPVAYSAFSL